MVSTSSFHSWSWCRSSFPSLRAFLPRPRSETSQRGVPLNCLKFAKLPFQVLAVCVTVSQVITRYLPTIVGQKLPDEWEHLWHICASKLLALCQNAGNFTAIKMLQWNSANLQHLQLWSVTAQSEAFALALVNVNTQCQGCWWGCDQDTQCGFFGIQNHYRLSAGDNEYDRVTTQFSTIHGNKCKSLKMVIFKAQQLSLL